MLNFISRNKSGMTKTKSGMTKTKSGMTKTKSGMTIKKDRGRDYRFHTKPFKK
jgi:hypothetical protein